MPLQRCRCQGPGADMQGAMYGSLRVMNLTKSEQLRCTVCGTLHGMSSAARAKAAKKEKKK